MEPPALPIIEIPVLSMTKPPIMVPMAIPTLNVAENMAVAMVEPSPGAFPMFTDCSALVNDVMQNPMTKLRTNTPYSEPQGLPMR